jgi:hypothetical protein
MFWISGADYLNPSMGNLDVVQVAMKLEQVGTTTINTSNNYSEDTTVRVTAVDASTGETLSGFTGTVNLGEDGTTIYSQNGGTLPSSVNITSGGTVTLVARSLAGPKTEGQNGQKPDDAKVKTTNYSLYGGSDLALPQWVISNTQIDPRAADPSTTYDWFQTRARDVFNAATGDVRTVLNAVSTYALVASTTSGVACQTHWVRGPQSPVVCVPYYTQLRLDSATNTICGNARAKFLTGSIYHEGRHAYQASLAALPGNDSDGDFLVNNIPIAPNSVFLDTATVRNVCNAAANLIVAIAYHGDTVFDQPGTPDFASFAWEMDAYQFAANH